MLKAFTRQRGKSDKEMIVIDNKALTSVTTGCMPQKNSMFPILVERSGEWNTKENFLQEMTRKVI